MPTLLRILVPVDFSRASRTALDYALFLAERFGATVEVMHVLEAPRYLPPDTLIGIPGEMQRPVGQIARTHAEREMEEMLAQMDLRPDRRPRTRLEAGDPAATIAGVAGSEGFDLIVMGTHGRTGLAHLLLGSVAEKIVRIAPCPVLTMRAGEPQAP
jgi:universal stress protein A